MKKSISQIKTLFLVSTHFLLIACLVAVGEAHAQSTTAAGTATAVAGSANWITVKAPLTGDDNDNGYSVFEWGSSSTGPWTMACENGTPGTSDWRVCTIESLTPGTNYFIQVTYVDPDGVLGTSVQVLGPISTPPDIVNTVSVGTAIATVGDGEIFVSIPISDDANMNSYGTVDIATSSGGPWTRKAGHPSSNRLPFNPKRARLRSLTPGTNYWVRVTVKDSDGVSGTTPQILGPILYTGISNLALNKPITADPGWGCCPNPAQLVDGRIQNDDWFYGFAWTGGTSGWGGGPAGWKQTTLDLGAPTNFNRAIMWYHGSNSVPTTWKVQYSDDGASWSEGFSTTSGGCRAATPLNVSWAYPSCAHDATFPLVTARYVRFTFDDRTLLGGLHGWGVEFEVYNSIVNQCMLEAATDTNQVGTEHTVTVTVKQNNVVQQGVAVTFDVFKGPNMGVSGTSSSPTDASGQATFTYTGGSTTGTDSIKASGTINGVPFECFAEKVWVDNQCMLAAVTDTNQVNTEHTVTVTVKQNNVVQQGVAITFDVFKGPNMGVSGTSSSPTDASGQATFTYTGGSTAGTDSIKASGAIDGVPFECFAVKIWVDNQCTLIAATDTNQVNTAHTVTVTVKQNNVVQQGVAVTFDVFKGPNMNVVGVSSSPTDASGQATFTYTGGNTAGTDSIKASGTINGVPFECFAEKVWVDNQCTLAAATDTNQVNTEHTVTVTVKQGGVVQQGVAVTFDVFKGPNMGVSGTSSSPTDASGQATFTYTGGSTTGTDSIKASGTINGVPFECFAEKVWENIICTLVPVTDQNQVGHDHTVKATVTHNGNPAQGVDVTFHIFIGPNSTTPNVPVATNASGEAVFTYTGNGGIGVDSIRASGTINGIPFECLVEKKWVESQNLSDFIGAEDQFPFFCTTCDPHYFEFEVRIQNTTTTAFVQPLFVEFISLTTVPPGSPITMANADGGGPQVVGAYYDYSDLMGPDNRLEPGELTEYKLWRFNDPLDANFFFDSEVRGVFAATPLAKASSKVVARLRFYVDVQKEQVTITLVTITTDVEEPDPLVIPSEFTLHQNYPNPFNPETTIRFGLLQASEVTINIYNLQGQLVRRLVQEEKHAGNHEIIWDARDDVGRSMPSGVYLYRIQAGEFTEVKKLMLLR